MNASTSLWYITLVVLSCAQAALAESRIAFVVGNSDYEEVESLPNPRNDASDVGSRLTGLGFTLHGGKVHYDLPKRKFLREYNRFSQAAKGTEIAFFYFAGHGMQFNGAPHVLPIDIPDDDLNIVQSDAVSLDALLNQINGKADLTIAVFDACREIPNYKSQIQRATRGGSDAPWRGLSRPKVKLSSSLIAYSGGSGELVADGNGRNSPYTELLLKYLQADRIQKERLDVRDVFSLVSYEFRQRHSGQSPELINQGVRPNQYYLASLPTNSQVLPNTGSAPQIESLLWQSAERGNTAAEYEAFLEQFPTGAFSGMARTRIARLKRSLPASEPTPLPTPQQQPQPQPLPERVATTGRLTVKVEPTDARVRIMNIKPRYRDGIELELNGRYDVLVTREGYQSWREKVLLSKRDQVLAVVLERYSVPTANTSQSPRGSGKFAVSGLPDGARLCFHIEGNWNCDRDVSLQVGGEYSVFASAPGYQDWQGRAILQRDGQSLLVPIAPEQARRSFEPEMVSIKGGRFTMGSPSTERDRRGNESQHEVRVGDFRISKYETTFDEYDAFAKATGRGLPSDRGWGRGSRPVILISWRDATSYAEWLSEQTGKRFRLPTEAEWEYAARAGSNSVYSWGDEIGENRVNCDGCGSRWDAEKTAPVGQFSANAWGVYDMHGNVWEWTCSAYDKDYDGSEQRCEPASSDVYRALRGGSWTSLPRNARAAYRNFDDWPVNADSDVGFRLAQD